MELAGGAGWISGNFIIGVVSIFFFFFFFKIHFLSPLIFRILGRRLLMTSKNFQKTDSG